MCSPWPSPSGLPPSLLDVDREHDDRRLQDLGVDRVDIVHHERGADDQHEDRPATVPPTFIRPPESGVPPITTAAMASSSIRKPRAAGSPAANRAVARVPAIPASRPLI